MKAIMVMFDSLNRHMLPSYGCDWTHMPNFARLARRTVTFDKAYVCSMPCMPARRELHTGRPNFLHRSWGPLEPFDDSMPEMLKKAGVYTHLATDHQHYFEDGGGTYHNRYSTWEFFRGQEGDRWMGQVAEPKAPECVPGRKGAVVRQDWVNRQFMRREEDQPQARTFKAGLDFIRRNHVQDQWFLQIETFDPHEPFFTQRKYKELYPHGYKGRHFDWPAYGKVEQAPEEVEHLRYQYAALASMCDNYLGEVIDIMDELDLWKDTMLIVCTDHGFLLGEHECWAKCWMPFYEEVAHVPLFIWDPRSGKAGERRQSLVQTIDLGPTLLEYFDVPRTKDMLGQPLRATVERDAPVREAGIFGIFGGQVNVTDGRYVYMRAPCDPDSAGSDLHEYSLMPTRMRSLFDVETLQDAQLVEGFPFMKGMRVMKTSGAKAGWRASGDCAKTLLYDLEKDPAQKDPISDPAVEKKMTEHLVSAMRQCDAPSEQYRRLGLNFE